MQLDPVQARVRPREVEVLEDAERPAVRRRDRLDDAQPRLVREGKLARLEVAIELGADEVERARLRRGNPVLVDAAEAERPEPV